MHPQIEIIKKECWDGKDKMPTSDIYNISQDSTMISAEGIQKQIDSSDANVVMVFVLDKYCKLQKYMIKKEIKNEN